MFLMSNNGARLGQFNPSLELRKKNKFVGPSLIFGMTKVQISVAISSYLTDGRIGRSILRFWTRRAGTEELAAQLQANNYLRLYHQVDTTDYLDHM